MTSPPTSFTTSPPRSRTTTRSVSWASVLLGCAAPWAPVLAPDETRGGLYGICSRTAVVLCGLMLATLDLSGAAERANRDAGPPGGPGARPSLLDAVSTKPLAPAIPSGIGLHRVQEGELIRVGSGELRRDETGMPVGEGPSDSDHVCAQGGQKERGLAPECVEGKQLVERAWRSPGGSHWSVWEAGWIESVDNPEVPPGISASGYRLPRSGLVALALKPCR